MRSSSRLISAVVVCAVVPLVLAGCASTPGTTGTTATSDSTVAPVSKGASQVRITLQNDGSDTCTLSSSTAKAGPVTFTVENVSATGITEVELLTGQRILGEKENLAPGLGASGFTVTLGGGSYSVYCPGAQKETVPFRVTGATATKTASTTTALLDQGTKDYSGYVKETVAALVTAVGELKTAVDAGDVAEAKKQYALARPFYERIESDVEGFVLPGFTATDNEGNLDYLIDMRASNLDPAVGWHGLHAIERDLWQGGRITSGTKTLAAELQTNVGRLTGVVAALSYRPEDLANGAASLLDEVQSGKIKGEEEAYSHLDLVDFNANVEGAQQAFANLEPGLQQIDPALTKTVQAEFTKVSAALDAYRDPSQAGGFKIYTAALRDEDAATLSGLVQGLQAPLSRIAEKVATAG